MKQNINEQISRIKGMMGLLNEQAETPICSETGCKGTYTGVEFNPQNPSDDVAHKYSNTITNAVAKKLKELYRSGTYVKVDFAKIKLTTAGMGSGNVVYTADIPFIGVTDKCDAMTGFAHVGGWGHSPALSNRKSEILNYKPNGKDNVVVDNKLDISNLKTTIEGLEEYFIQWKHRDYQSDCSGASVNNQQSNSAGQNVTIKGIDLDDLRAKISASTKNISIDVSSIKIDAPNFSVSYKPGSEQIKTMSFIWDDRGDLERRFEGIQAKNPTIEKIENGTIQNIQWALSIIR